METIIQGCSTVINIRGTDFNICEVKDLKIVYAKSSTETYDVTQYAHKRSDSELQLVIPGSLTKQMLGAYTFEISWADNSGSIHKEQINRDINIISSHTL